jgi:hypothetical protein
LLAHGQWFSPGTPASSTTKTGCHDIAEILLMTFRQSNMFLKKLGANLKVKFYSVIAHFDLI